MDLLEYVRSGFLVLLFLLAVLQERQVWMNVDLFAAAGFGAAFCLFPSYMIDFQTDGTLDHIHLHLARLFGVTLMCGSLVWWLTRETRDGTVPITLMTSRVFSCGILLLAILYAQVWSTKTRGLVWNEQHMTFGMLGCGLWLLGNWIHLVRSSDFSTYPQHNNRLNIHLRIDAWLVITGSLMYYAFPKLLLSFAAKTIRPDQVHLHLVRVLGVQGIGSGIISLQAPGFLHERDKKAQLYTRIMSQCVALLILAVNHFLYDLFTNQQLIIAVCVSGAIIANAAVGCFVDSYMFYTPKKIG